MRARGLSRLVDLFAKVEAMRGLELRVAAAAVVEVEQGRAAELDAGRMFGADGRGALAVGDRAGWACADSMREAADGRGRRLRVLLEEREAAADDAARVHRESRLAMEQIKQVVAGIRAEEAVVAGRREQAGMDDRFAARGVWMAREKERMRVR